MTPDTLRRFALPAGFFALALLTGWLLAGVLPLGQAADEAAHAVRVDALSHGRVLGHREGTSGGFTTQPTLADVAFKTPARHPQARAERDAAEAVTWDAPRRFIELGTIDYWFAAGERRIHKYVHHYLLEAVGGHLTIENDPDQEAIDVAWLPLRDAHRHLTFPNERRIARVAWQRLAGDA